MCGICGIMQFNGGLVDKALVTKMCQTLVHRGPDGEGVYTAPYIGLGQRRLSIIDLSPKALPPLSNEDNSVWLVFNGEIYNFKELRVDLIEKGHTFRSETDTEVIIHLYEEYGIKCLDHLRGMFAFALWDAEKNFLFAARDRLGKKPFCYTKNGFSLVFGSEIKAITANPHISTSPNFYALDSYLSNQYVPSPLTAFADINKLPPAHFLICTAAGTLTIEKYWSPPLPEKSLQSQDHIEYELLRLLQESVRLRLVSDVPLGALLSGGIDSGTIIALMARESSKPIKTFSIGFEETDFSELPYARLVADRYGTDHHELIVKPSALEILPLLVRHYNEPFADSSALPTYYVSKLTREYVTVALSGDGGDESFAGYRHYEQVLRWEKADWIPWPIRRKAWTLIQKLDGKLPYHNLVAKAMRGFQMIGSQLPGRYILQLSILKDQEKHICYSPKFKGLINDVSSRKVLTGLPWDDSMDSLDWMMRHDQNYYLPDCLMVKTDIASMANSLELRCPFLDHKIVEYSASIPSAMKRRGLDGKLILKSAVKSLLPAEIINKKKQGFKVPLGKWFQGELSEFLRGTLLDDKTSKRGLFNQPFLKKMVDDQVLGRKDWSNRLWALLILEMWFREFID
jgi:asparagine synthase (glutamine-hydrolysing)